jgi:E3 ubiquitin-protein ligase DOA10
MCRICFGDAEDGRLISPCLCKGSMRFVHAECLTMWRNTSANQASFFACDSCMYRYSFRRPLFCSILRSALVVNAVSLLLFSLVSVWSAGASNHV